MIGEAERRAVVARVRQCIESAQYRFDAIPEMAPEIVNCYVLIYWGWRPFCPDLPLYPDAQQTHGRPVETAQLAPADLVFASAGHGSRYPQLLHVGLASGGGRVIHAIPRYGVVEVTLERFFRKRTPRGACRIIQPDIEPR